jgi:REP element-mobilizing transposase RayT
MYHRLLVHIVWTTRDRMASIDRARAAYLWEHLPIIARQERSRILALGLVTTHLHLLIRLHPTTRIPPLLQRMNGGTSHGLNEGTAIDPQPLRWAKGYSITSVSPRAMPRVTGSVRSQHTHHPEEAIPGWSNPPVASATPAAPGLSAARSVAMPPWPSSRSMR